jgi:hypothetical protein
MGLHRHGAACGCRPGSLDCDDFDFCEHGTSSSRSGRHPRATRFRPGPGSRIDRDRVGGNIDARVEEPDWVAGGVDVSAVQPAQIRGTCYTTTIRIQAVEKGGVGR